MSDSVVGIEGVDALFLRSSSLIIIMKVTGTDRLCVNELKRGSLLKSGWLMGDTKWRETLPNVDNVPQYIDADRLVSDWIDNGGNEGTFGNIKKRGCGNIRGCSSLQVDG